MFGRVVVKRTANRWLKQQKLVEFMVLEVRILTWKCCWGQAPSEGPREKAVPASLLASSSFLDCDSIVPIFFFFSFNSYFFPISSVFPHSPLFFPVSHPGYMVFSCHDSLGASWLWQFLRLSVLFLLFVCLFLIFWPHHAECGIWVPWPGVEPRPLYWKCGVLASRPAGKSPIFTWCSLVCMCVYVQITPFYKDTSYIGLGEPSTAAWLHLF